MTVKTRTMRRRSHRRPVVVTVLLTTLCLLLVTGAVAAIAAWRMTSSWLEDLPDYQNADAYAVAEPTQVFDARGNVIASFYLQNRRSVPLTSISEYVKKATIDTEDVRFYEHNGVDMKGIARAVIRQMQGDSQGASTITQQLVRNTVLSDEQFEHSLKRKFREAYIAMEIEKSFSKDQILGMYLNTIYYGHDAYGIEAASITYFNKHADELTLSEAALLSGLPQSPSYYDPFANPESAKSRRDMVLDRMVAAGDLSESEANAAKEEELVLSEGSLGNDPVGTYPFFTDYIREELLANYDMSTIFQGGLRVYTTIDPDCQAAAEESVRTVLDDIGDSELEAGFVAIEPSTGHLLAMIGGRDYNVNQFNLATQAKRQVGSSFKAFTLAAAIEEGVDPEVIIDCSSSFEVDENWTVHNVNNADMGEITLREATYQSSNTGFVRVEKEIGLEPIRKIAQGMGIPSEGLPDDLTMTLGTGGIPPIKMAAAYATFANDGVYQGVKSITRIENANGTPLFTEDTSGERVLSPEVNYATHQVLEGVVSNSSGTANVVDRMTSGIVDQPIAGKTGTTENARDLWFCGYTPQVACATWVGYREERRIYVDGDDGHPYNTACPIFAEYLNRTLADVPRAEFSKADEPDYANVSKWEFSLGRGLSEEERAARDAAAAARRAEEEARQRAEEEARAEEERQQQEADQKAQEEAQKAAEAAKKQAEAEARKAQEEARKKAQEEARRQKEEEPEPADDTGGDTGDDTGGDTGGDSGDEVPVPDAP